jgi:uridine phosphorylase
MTGDQQAGIRSAPPRSSDRPILTPGQVIQLRGVDVEQFSFDVAVLCFRGLPASRRVIDAFGAVRIESDVLYGSEAYAGGVGDRQVVILPKVIWGGPATAILLEEINCFGAQVAIGFGAAGSLVSQKHIGRVLIADRAVCSDGTSREYTDKPDVGPDPELFELTVALASEAGVTPVVGTVHTTDALYQEWPDRIRRWREEGAAFVNLETSPFYATAAYCGVRAVYLGLVTDYVGGDQDWEHGFWGRSKTPDPAIVRLIQRLVEAVELDWQE